MPCKVGEHTDHDVKGMIVMLVIVFAAGFAAGLVRTVVMQGLRIHCGECLLCSAVIELLERQGLQRSGLLPLPPAGESCTEGAETFVSGVSMISQY